MTTRSIVQRHRRRRRRLRTAAATVLMMAAATVALGITPLGPASAATGGAHVSALAAPPCQDGYSCVSIPCSTSPCPTVEAGPTSNLGAAGGSQFVFVNLYDFPAGDAPALWYCSAVTALATGPPLCATAPSPLQLPEITTDGTAFENYQVEEVGEDGGTPLNGEVPGNPTVKGTFFCDDGANPCSLDVFDQALDGQASPDTANTAVIPVSFVASSSGCPHGTVVNSESDFGIEGLLTEVAPAACGGTAPAVPVNTAENSVSAVQALASGTVQIAYTDDPEAADEKSALSGTGSHYDYIPVAASADVVAFSADDALTSRPLVPYPDTSFALTPNMVAGLISLQYSAPGTADAITGLSCVNSQPPPKTYKACPAMQTVNSVTGILPPATYWANVRSDNAGVTDEFFQWLCAAQDRSVTIAGLPATETKTAAQVLESASWTDKSLKTTCASGDQFPALGITGDWAGASSPAAQARDVVNEVANAIPSRTAAFATMNWFEALYYGLNVAQLQNAAGQYVAPSATSVDAALADASVDASTGVLSNSYANSGDAAAYPTPVVIYAVVPTDLPAAMAGAVGTELRSVLAVTTAAAGSAVPPGLLPLPATLASQANSTVATDFPAPAAAGRSGPSSPGATPTAGPSSPSSAGFPTGPSGTFRSGVSGVGGISLGVGVLNHSAGSSTGSGSSGPGPGTDKTPALAGGHKGVTSDFLGLVAPGGRWLLIGLLAAGAIAILLGPMILGMLRVRRRGDGEGEGDFDPDAAGGTVPAA